MWLSQDLIPQVESRPHPEVVLSRDLRQQLLALELQDATALRESLAPLLVEVWLRDPQRQPELRELADAADAGDFVHRPLDGEVVLSGQEPDVVGSRRLAEHVAAQVRAAPLRWRLDVATLLDDCLHELVEHKRRARRRLRVRRLLNLR
jgi:hypothetical protein